MSDTVVLGIRNSGVNNIYQLPPHLTIDDVDVLIHFNPMVRLEGNRFSCNCDIALDLTNPGDDPDVLLEAALDDQYYHIPRLRKSHQYAKLLSARNRAGESFLAELVIPPMLTASITAHGGRNTMNPIDRLGSSFGLGAGEVIERMVVKPENGARGQGQALVPIDQLRPFFNDLGLPLSELKKRYPDVVFTKHDPNGQEKEEDPKLADLGTWTITEYIDDIDEEYRVLIAGDKIYISSRDRSKGEFPQANVDLDMIPEDKEFSEIQSSNPLHSLVADIANVFNLRLGSIDLFKTTADCYGFFECCPQFGLIPMPHDEAFKIHHDFLRWLVNRYLDREN